MTDDQRSTCGQRELAVGWAVHSLEPEEEVSFAEHLQHCQDCVDQVRATEDVASVLGRGVTQLDPPARLREAVLAAARATPVPQQVSPVHLRSVPRSPAPPTTPVRTPAGQPVSRSRRLLVAAAAVGVLAFGAGWVGNTALQSGGPATVQDVAGAQVRETVLRDVGSSAPVAVVLDDGTSASVVPVDLGAAPAGSAYWLWGTGAGDPVPLGEMAVGDSGTATVAADAGTVFTGYAVSTEPAGTTPTTPSTVLAAGTVTT